MNSGLRELYSNASLAVAFLLGGNFACTSGGISNQYVSAEKLWTQKDYKAAVAEFDQISKSDPSGTLGIQSLYRASLTRTLFLSEHEVAVQGLQQVIERAPSSELATNSIREIGEIYFARLENWTKALAWYETYQADPRVSLPDRLEFRKRRARCLFRLRKLEESILAWNQILEDQTLQGRDRAFALLEQASVYLTKGDNDGILRAQSLYEEVGKKFPGSEHSVEAQIGLGNVLELQSRLNEALEKYQSVLGKSNRDEVLKVLIARLENRISKKSESKKAPTP